MRKLNSVIVAGSLLALSLLFSFNNAMAEQTFPLICRGGDDMKFSFHRDRDHIVIQFKKGTTGAGTGETLLPGQCSWIDRGFRPDEGELILHKGVRAFEIWWSGNRVERIMSRDAPYLNDLRDPTKKFIFQVYRSWEYPGYYFFVIKRFGP